MIKLINPKSKESIILKIQKIDYPDFYKIFITTQVANELKIEKNLPLIEILEIKKNKSFIAKKAKIFQEEKKISSKAPVTSVKIANISKNKKNLKKDKIKMDIVIATFFSKESAKFLKKRIATELPNFDATKLQIIKKNNKKINLLSGPYSSVNSMKNDYIKLINFGFEELDIIINE